MSIHISVAVAALILAFPFIVSAQDTGGAPADSFTEPIYRPSKDLDNYGFSDLDKSSFGESSIVESDFGGSIGGTTNVDLNKALEEEEARAREEEAKARAEGRDPLDEFAPVGEPGGDASLGEFAPGDEVEAPENEEEEEIAGPELKPLSPRALRKAGIERTGRMYKWVDSDGVIHVTNNVGFVPLGPQNDEPEPVEDEKPGEDEEELVLDIDG